MSRHTLETRSGLFLDLTDPSPAAITLEDIAWGLANTCRFGGHTSVFYSVAEHALLCRALIIENGHPHLAIDALHHDSHEAYIGDLPTPLKNLLGDEYKEITQKLDEAIAEGLGLAFGMFNHRWVKETDELALRMEAYFLKQSKGVGEHWGFWAPITRRPPWNLGLQDRTRVAEMFMRAHRDELASLNGAPS